MDLLPQEILLSIFRHLDLQSLTSVAQVSRLWRVLVDDTGLWTKLHLQFCESGAVSNDGDIFMNQGAPSTLPSEGESVELQPSQVDLGGEQNETNSNIHRVFDLDEKYRLRFLLSSKCFAFLQHLGHCCKHVSMLVLSWPTTSHHERYPSIEPFKWEANLVDAFTASWSFQCLRYLDVSNCKATEVISCILDRNKEYDTLVLHGVPSGNWLNSLTTCTVKNLFCDPKLLEDLVVTYPIANYKRINCYDKSPLPSSIDIKCCKCGCVLYRKLKSYCLAPPQQGHISKEVHTNTSPSENCVIHPIWNDSRRLTCSSGVDCHGFKWLVDGNSGVVNLYSFAYGVALGPDLAVISECRSN